MSETRVPLYERLPEIYRIKDEQQSPKWQLRNYLGLVESVYGEIHRNIENLYDDLFIETCDDWVIPYIGDLLGTSHLKGEPQTLRADVADTIALRRRKGTLASIERLTYNLTKWGVHCVELRENLVWNQHLNHQRPDEGGDPPYGQDDVTIHTPIRGGTVVLRDPAMLSLLGTPFDPFAHLVDVKPPTFGALRYNLPNLAVFLWRLKDYRVEVCHPGMVQAQATGKAAPEAAQVVRVAVHPMNIPVRLFNTYQFEANLQPPVVTEVDETPGPIPRARLNSASEAGQPEKYLTVDVYDENTTPISGLDIADVGLQLHLPASEFAGEVWPENAAAWKVRGADLCAWEDGTKPPVKDREIVVDPDIGRILIGVATAAEAQALENHLLVTYTYGAVGPVGAHPTKRTARPTKIGGEEVEFVDVNYHLDPNGLQKALDNLQNASMPKVIEIQDSMTHRLDLLSVAGTVVEMGGRNLRLNKSLVIRAADGERPVIALKRPLRARAKTASEIESISLRLEGIYLTHDQGFTPAASALIARAEVGQLQIVSCTLDPGGHLKFDGDRADIRVSLSLPEVTGHKPQVVLQCSIAGPLLIHRDYHLTLKDTILDAGKGVGEDPENAFALSDMDDPENEWGPPTEVDGLTVFGRTRVENINGRGGIWVHSLEALNNQRGCIRYSYFSGVGDRLPQNLGCVSAGEAELHFSDEIFGSPPYAQIAHSSDFRIKERGPEDDQMGAFGFLLEAHKWRNLQIRYREFMPAGIRPLLIPVT